MKRTHHPTPVASTTAAEDLVEGDKSLLHRHGNPLPEINRTFFRRIDAIVKSALSHHTPLSAAGHSISGTKRPGPGRCVASPRALFRRTSPEPEKLPSSSCSCGQDQGSSAIGGNCADQSKSVLYNLRYLPRRKAWRSHAQSHRLISRRTGRRRRRRRV